MIGLASETVGDVLREWRRYRRFSQIDLAAEAQISTRHLSFVESGRSSPSRDVLLRLAGALDMPLRGRNRLLLAGGLAPQFPERSFDAPDMRMARQAVEAVLTAHEPFPAVAVDRHWTLVAANRSIMSLLRGVSARLLTPPVNVLRLTLEPDGLAPSILNYGAWRRHLTDRLRRDAAASGDPALFRLCDELQALPAPPAPPAARQLAELPIAVPLVLRSPAGGETLSLLSTTTVFGTATDVTLAELTLECFYPADEDTRSALARLPPPSTAGFRG
ncbi:helix-turn-helix domain-containing protein [Jiella pacifica]|uniref:Helix-turn-helix domain-containing protein n=1 Tax=Jiella pacifica TaxID=2696469 RepID=A0A6N9T6V1_9HYPH|nr:helix-turn-helix transcriptional regulator [Jiella pacifica]NDW06282.1 helix-turn-helix domain-containing protein [Jiella pacifica]